MPATFGDVYEQLVARFPDPGERGRHFERLVVDVMRTDRTFRQRFDAVWHWREWPGNDGGDIGVDIVARRRDGGHVAIQCKCYDPERPISKGHIDSFLANTQEPFSERLVVTTTSKWGGNALRMLERQQPAVQRIDLFGLEATTIDWGAWDWDDWLRREGDGAAPLAERPRRQPRPHQEEALAAVREGFAAHDRGKLIMACGTGKTLTALRVAEEVAGRGGRVLFAAPSISLLAQAMREWGADAELPIRAFAVCSDEKVGSADGDGARTYDLPIAATTNAARLAGAASADAPDRLTVVFSTYQSMERIAEAQQRHGLPAFDLVVCDEAHRTTGYALEGEERSHFLLVHDGEAIRARKRLYMTATPRIYTPAARQKAEDARADMASMDDEAVYGPEFHRLGFANAVEQGLLSDYKVTVLVMSEEQIARDFQRQIADSGKGRTVDDVGRVIGCLNGLAKHDPEGRQFTDDADPMHRAVAFSNTIKNSQHFVELVRELQDEIGIAERNLKFEAAHVDGKSGVLERAERLRWLGAETLIMERQCNILSNARCLTEGIDVPALDAVLFLQPRKSQIDVVQAVGRVMRRAEGKKYGYVVLPVVVPTDEDPARALDRNDAYAHVWQVLQALRSHDERLDAYINQIDLNRDTEGRVNVIGVPGGGSGDGDGPASVRQVAEQAIQYGFDLGKWRDAIYAKIVQRCGDRRYWEKWAESVTDIARVHHERIRALIAAPDSGVGPRFDEFVAALQRNLNDSITPDDAAAMLSQHLITRPVFDALFGGARFTERNPVSRVMERMIGELRGHGLEAETAELDDFYASVRRRVEGIDNAAAKQRVVNELYEQFFRLAFRKDAERLGIVYTPTEIVDFILRSVDHLLRREFGTSIGGEGVHVLDPFTGTGTFITRLLHSGLIERADLSRKYAGELHANEIMLLAYYIAAVNIESAYADLAGEYQPFEGIVLTDTFQLAEAGNPMDPHFFPYNNRRAERQQELDIRVIIGNPPWSVGQRLHDDDNANQPYPTLDKRISSAYIALSEVKGLKNPLYDSYVRAIRWASDRISEREDGGVIGFVTNSGFLDSKAFDGFRKAMTNEFHEIYVYNLRGNQRTAGEQSKLEGGKVFGSGSRAGVAILLLVKRPDPVTNLGSIRYHDIGGYLSREAKLDHIGKASIDAIRWESIEPNEHGDWINQRSPAYLSLRPVAAIRSEIPSDSDPIFVESSNGVKTNRDAWLYNSSKLKLYENAEKQALYFNDQVDALQKGNELDRDPSMFKWDKLVEERAIRGLKTKVSLESFRHSIYRPFFRQHFYMDQVLTNSLTQNPRIFPTPDTYVPSLVMERGLRALGRAPAVLAVNVVPDIAAGAGASGLACYLLPRYTYDLPADADQSALLPGEPRRRDNISDDALADYRASYGDGVTKDHIFAYVYGVLHHPDYRARYATDLAKLLPRIPKIADAIAFYAIASAGQNLLDLHIGYEDARPYPLEELWGQLAPADEAERYRVEKMRWGGKRGAEDRTRIVYNEWLTLAGIPDEAHGYAVGPRSALEWLIDRYRVRTDKASGIVNDVNAWGLELDPPNARYIAELVKRIVTVSVETVGIVASLPPLEEAPPG